MKPGFTIWNLPNECGKLLFPFTFSSMSMEQSYTIKITVVIFAFADVDECTRGADSCHENATCNNTEGNYTCSCNTGHTGDGFVCTSKPIY